MIFWDSIPCVFCVYILNVVSHYYLSVLSISVMGFQKSLDREVGGWLEVYPVFLVHFLNFFNFAKPLI